MRIENSVCKKIDGVIFPCLEDGVHPFEGRAKHTTTIDNMPRLEEIYNYYKGDAKEACFPYAMQEVCLKQGDHQPYGCLLRSEGSIDFGGQLHKCRIRSRSASKVQFLLCRLPRGYNREQLKDILEEASLGASTLLPVGQYKNIKNLPTKVYEYMSMGLPVLLSDHPYGREVVAKYNFAELVDAENPHAMAEMILELKNDPERCRRLGQNGRKAVKEVFNWDVEEEKLFNFYEEICGE